MLILRRSETLGLLPLEVCVQGVEDVFRAYGEGRSLGVTRVHLDALDGGVFHMTAGGVAPETGGAVVAVKLNGRFPPGVGGGQRVSGAVLVSDAATGDPVALLDSMVVTSIRTAAVTALVTRLLARRGAASALLVGGGRQSRGQIDALRLAGLDRLRVHDLHRPAAEAAADYARGLGLDAEALADVGAAARHSDVVVTITPARAPILQADDIASGALVVALGADGPGKQELDPALLARSLVVVDIVDQAADSGDLQHALAAGLMRREDVHAELGEIVAGLRPGRSSDDETFVFDGTGTALQDVAAATLLLAEARRAGLGVDVDLTA